MRILDKLAICIMLANFSVSSIADTQAGDEVTAPAAESVSGDMILDDLLQVLDQETELATRTKMNIDHVPGMVSVVHGADALNRGARNVYEAMGLIPGLELSISSDGSQMVLVRGIGNVFASGKIKALVNGVAFNTALSAFTSVYAMPIEQVDRIEFIHGPGSTVHGEYAFSGVLNVITRRGISESRLRLDSNKAQMLGLIVHEELKDSALVMDLNMAGFNADSSGNEVESDRLHGTLLESTSNAPGKTNEEEKVRSAMFHADYEGFTFNAQYLKRQFGDYFGINDVLPDSEGLLRSLTMQTYVFGKEITWAPKVMSQFNIGWRYFELDSGKLMLFPEGFRNSFMSEGVLGGPHYEESEFFAAMDLTAFQVAQHQFVFGIEYHKLQQGDTWVRRNYDPVTFEEVPYVKYTGSENWLAEDLEREVVSFYIQDEYSLTDRFSANVGLRLDNYDDVGTTDSPRLSLIYKFDNQHTVKFQAARAFRPPTFLEQYTQNNPVVSGNQNLSPEYVENYEMGYIFKLPDTVFRLTAFRAHLENLITVDSAARVYRNTNEADLQGLEMMVDYRFSRQWRVDGAWSQTHAHDHGTENDFAGVAHNLFDMGVQYAPVADYLLSMQLTAVGERTREPTDARKDLQGYSTIDLTFNVSNVLFKGLDLHLGIKNATDEDVIYPAPAGTYPDDYPRGGRSWWTELGYQF